MRHVTPLAFRLDIMFRSQVSRHTREMETYGSDETPLLSEEQNNATRDACLGLDKSKPSGQHNKYKSIKNIMFCNV